MAISWPESLWTTWGALKHALHAKQPEFRGPGGFSMWQEKALSTTITKDHMPHLKGEYTRTKRYMQKPLNRDHLILFMAMLCFTSVQFWDVLYFNVNPIKNKRRASGPITLVFLWVVEICQGVQTYEHNCSYKIMLCWLSSHCSIH